MMGRRIEISSYEVDDAKDGPFTFWEWSCDECGRSNVACMSRAIAHDEADTHDCDED